MSFARKEEAYNGWCNYETWCVNLWITNDPGTSEHLYEILEPYRRGDRANMHLAADAIKEWVEDMLPDLGASFAADHLGAAMSEVNWYEIAENHFEDEP